MEPQIKEYVHYLLIRIKELYGEVHALRSLNEQSPAPWVREHWRENLAYTMGIAEYRSALDDMFDSHIQSILAAIENVEEIGKLLRSPTKGLPN